MRYSVVIGALNEEKRLPKTLRELEKFLRANKLYNKTEVIVVAADGKDNTANVARKSLKNFKYSQLLQPGKPVGKGRDIKNGMLSANGTYRIYMDADLATPLKHMLDAFSILENGDADIVIGSRDIRKMHNSLSRRAISILGNIAFAVVSGFYLPDSQCGFKAFTDTTAKLCFSKLTRMQWSFDMEVLLVARIHDKVIAQLPIADWSDIEGGTFKSGFRQTTVFGMDLITLLFNRLKGTYR